MAKDKIHKKGAGLWKEFKEFINRGNAFMLAVGVVIGGAFSAIVNSFVSILTSIATWPVPGGLKGLVTVLPALTDAQKGLPDIGQSFTTAQLQEMVFKFAENSNAVVGTVNADGTYTVTDTAGYAAMQTALLSKYTLHGTVYTYNMSAVIDWGTFINAVISFLIIAIVLFIIVKIMNNAAKRKEELEAKRLELYYEKHPEERPVPPEPGKPAPTQEELLTGILAELKKANGEKPAE